MQIIIFHSILSGLTLQGMSASNPQWKGRSHVATMWCLLPGIFGLVASNSTEERCSQPEGLLAHTIGNNNPYDGIPPVKPGQG